MDALLNLDSPRGNYVCSSIREIQDKLHHSLASKSSDTRAEHTSLTFEFRHNTVFHLNADNENNNPDGAVDPTSQSQQQPIARSVNVSETVQSQPTDDPVLQRAVAKHIVGAMGVVDSSTWVVRQVSRSAQGWTFTYICKDSLQAWNRANGKSVEKPVIASYSGPGSLDPTNASRPAFDCRGTLTITFSKSARSVVVKYNHTPIHKTVQQLFELLAPDLPPPPANKGNVTNQRTPRVKRPPPAEGEEGSRRKRARKKGKAPEAPMEDPVNPAGGSGQADQNAPEPQNVSQNNVHYTSVINVPPDEAARRRQTAIELLTAEGIDPATLSQEQFEIFSNQSPDLQKTSLEMLKMYGAERLRIVHPPDVEEDTPSTSTPAEAQSSNVTPATTSVPVATPTATETPTKKPKRSRKKKSDAAAAKPSAVVPVEQNGEVGTTTSTLKLTARKTRGNCETCKSRKRKIASTCPLNHVEEDQENLARWLTKRIPICLEKMNNSEHLTKNKKKWKFQQLQNQNSIRNNKQNTIRNTRDIQSITQCIQNITRRMKLYHPQILTMKNSYLIQTFCRFLWNISQLQIHLQCSQLRRITIRVLVLDSHSHKIPNLHLDI
ncbi:hypothetical protein ABKA04_006377 [Annulohypoxylon sp. FPYF3050]